MSLGVVYVLEGFKIEGSIVGSSEKTDLVWVGIQKGSEVPILEKASCIWGYAERSLFLNLKPRTLGLNPQPRLTIHQVLVKLLKEAAPQLPGILHDAGARFWKARWNLFKTSVSRRV